MIAWAYKKFGFFGDKDSDNEETVSSSRSSSMIDDDHSTIRKVKLNVIGLEGYIWSFILPTSTSVDALKCAVINQFYSSPECNKLSSNFNLVAVSSKKVLDPNLTILEENLQDHDEILLVERCIRPDKSSKDNDDNGPTNEDIERATRNLIAINKCQSAPRSDCLDEFQSDIRRMFVSLAQTSARLLSANPDADDIYNVIVSRLDLNNKQIPDSQVVKQLMDMGFSEKKVIHALTLKRQNATDALEWLLDGSESVNSSSLSLPSIAELSSPAVSKMSLVERITRLLKVYSLCNLSAKRNQSITQEKSDKDSCEPEDILEKSGNSSSDAVQAAHEKKEEKVCLGLDKNDVIYKALHSNPAIILGLSNPKTLLALISILDSPLSANMWLNDAEIAPILNQVFKAYHTEKHAINVSGLSNNSSVS